MKQLMIVNDLDKKRIIRKISMEPNLIDCNIIGYQEFLKKFYFDYDEEAIYEITQTHHVTKEIAELYLKNCLYLQSTEGNSLKIKQLNEIKTELIQKHLIQDNDLWKDNLKKRKLIFYHIARQDKLFQKTIKACTKLTKVEIINWEPKETHPITITEYSEIKQEVIGTISKICSFLKKEYNPSQIFLTNLTDRHRELLELYGPIFHLSFDLKKEESLLSTSVLTTFLENYDQSLDIAIAKIQELFSLPEEKEIIQKIIQVCNRYAFISEEEKKKPYIFDDLKKMHQKENKCHAIKEIDFYEEELPENSHLFVLGLHEGNIPIITKDEQFFSDQEFQELGLNTASERNAMERNLSIQKLQQMTNADFSFARKDGKIELYPSSILEELEVKIVPGEEVYNHSNLYNQITLTDKLDQLKKYGTRQPFLDELLATYPKIPYRKYQNQWRPFSIEKKPIRLSYSSLDTFFHCSFRYYLDQILHLNIYEDTLDRQIGNLFHQVLKESYEPEFDFTKSWEQHVEKMSLNNAREHFFVHKLQKDLQRVLKTLKEQEAGKNFQIKTEEQKDFYIEALDATLTGIFDKLFIGFQDGKTLISVVDYKTGNPNLNLDHLIYGLNMQLPIYLTLLRQLPYENIHIVGFYLQKILPTIPERDHIHTEEELKQKKLMLQGYSIDEESILSVFDPTYENSKLIASLKKSSKGFYAYSKVLSEEQLSKIEKIVMDKISEAVQSIKQSKFEINPKRIGPNLVGCNFCKYQDICYRKEENIKNEKEIKAASFLGGEKHANMDERTE